MGFLESNGIRLSLFITIRKENRVHLRRLKIGKEFFFFFERRDMALDLYDYHLTDATYLVHTSKIR